MAISIWDGWCWALGFVGFLALIAVLFLRKRYKTFPWFTSLVVYEITQTIVLFLVHSHGTKRHYFYAFWTGDAIESLIRIGVMFELARITAKHVSQDSQRIFTWVTTTLLAASAACVYFVLSEHALKNSIMNFAVKTSLCTSILGWSLAFTIFLLTFFEGIRLRVHSQALAYGLVVYFSAKMLGNIAILGQQADWWAGVQSAVKPLYILCLFVWAIVFWLNEPKQVLNDEMAKYSRMRHAISISL